MLLAKSAGENGKAESLLDHSRNVAAMARLLYWRLPKSVKTDENLFKDLEAAALIHDIGKAATGFQEVLCGRRKDWHGWRHEVISAGFASNLPVSEEVVFAVMTHHKQIPGDGTESKGRLAWTQVMPDGWRLMIADWLPNQNEAVSLWTQLCVEAGRQDLLLDGALQWEKLSLRDGWLDRRRVPQRKAVPAGERLRASLLRGLLMGADHLASAGKKEIPPAISLKTFEPKFELRSFQKRCAIAGSVILDAPTGSGKTEAALVWAGANQPENGRFFYTLPYTAALNAMHSRLEQTFPKACESIGLLHGRAAHQLYRSAQEDYPSDPKKANDEAQARANLAREMFYPVRVCTPHQLLRFTLRGRGWEQMLAEIPGACIVFDEVHSYDARLAGLTLGTARLFSEMGARLMFISATLPSFMRKLIEGVASMNAVAPSTDEQTDREVLNRKRHEVTVSPLSLEELLPQIVDFVRDGKKVMVVCNHVRSAQAMSRLVREELKCQLEDVCLFHGRFNMRDRKEKEARLSGALPKVLVATQVVEVSLDISYDVGFFEAAPIDALVQRMGRVNRQGVSPAPVIVACKAISKHRIYDDRLVRRTVELLEAMCGAISEQDLKAICDEVYGDGYEGENKRIFEQCYSHNFLTKFEDSLVAGQHVSWIDQVIESTDGRAEVLPLCLKGEYDGYVQQRRWLAADALLVNAYTSGISHAIVDRKAEPWVVDLPYDQEGLHAKK